jgi:predicted 2-oxoglutarate/Fe(II)-dependent dioxygenase YbiX
MEKSVLPKNHIFVFDDVISDELCNIIKNIINQSTYTKKEDYSNSNVKGEVMFLCDFQNKSIAKTVENKVYDVVSNLVSKMRNCSGGRIIISSGCDYQIRKITGATKYHQDGILVHNSLRNEKFIKVSDIRSMSLIIALNDDYDGGELCFPDQDFKIKLKKGQAIAFPPYWTHPHYTTDLMNGTVRYTINTWLCE